MAKVAGLKQRTITGPAKVFDGEEACFEAIQARQIKAGRRGRDPRRRAGRRAGHARDAVASPAALIGPGAGRERRPHHRRPVLRRHARPGRRATSPRRRGSAARSRWCRTATRSPSTATRSSSTLNVPAAEMRRPQGQVEGARVASRTRGAGEVREARPLRERGGRDGVSGPSRCGTLIFALCRACRTGGA